LPRRHCLGSLCIQVLAPEERAFVFTHGDLFPRNILVSGNPPRITGIVDYEFSGFFPKTEEFVNEFVGGAGNWPKWFTAAYHEKLESLGVATPLKGIDHKVWARIIALDRLIAHIAPWWLAGQRSEGVLRDALKDADEVVRRKISELESSVDS
jgi:phosphotransferase family enzyme